MNDEINLKNQLINEYKYLKNQLFTHIRQFWLIEPKFKLWTLINSVIRQNWFDYN